MSEFDAHIDWLNSRTAPLVIGIAGGSGSGKSRISEAVEAALAPGIVAIQHDSYYRDLSLLPPEQRRVFNFDHPDALETDLLVSQLDQLLSGGSVDLPEYDFATHCRAHTTRRIASAPIILLEGIMVLHEPALRERMDLRIFVDTPADVRLIRRMKRDMAERGRSPEQTMAQYLDTVRPMHNQFVAPCREHAHLIVPWGYTPAGVAMILAALTELRRGLSPS
ncbi:MAG: uridine kinase [Myxococcota bacterium]|jgi:uridine kinase